MLWYAYLRWLIYIYKGISKCILHHNALLQIEVAAFFVIVYLYVHTPSMIILARGDFCYLDF